MRDAVILAAKNDGVKVPNAQPVDIRKLAYLPDGDPPCTKTCEAHFLYDEPLYVTK